MGTSCDLMTADLEPEGAINVNGREPTVFEGSWI
jgi:hypothetical protein